METQKTSGDMFSFPDFGFDSSPDSPFNDPNKNDSSPADRFFFNGRLLPHVFPTQENTNYGTTRRSSSVSSSSKDSFVSWSPSNSTYSSRSSSCSSTRTSSSDNSERKLFYNRQGKFPIKATTKIGTIEKNYKANRHVFLSNTPPYGPSKRWQLITPAPALNPEFLRRKKVAVEVAVKDDLRTKKEVRRTRRKSGFVRRFFRWFMFACRECHAMAPSKREDVCRFKEEPKFDL